MLNVLPGIQTMSGCGGGPGGVTAGESVMTVMENRLPVALHVHDDPAAPGRPSESARELTDVGRAVVGPFPLGVGVMDDEAEREPGRRCRPLEHLEVAVGVAECRDRTPADDLMNADRLPGLVVDEIDLGRAAAAPARRCAISYFTFARLPTTCSGGMP